MSVISHMSVNVYHQHVQVLYTGMKTLWSVCFLTQEYIGLVFVAVMGDVC